METQKSKIICIDWSIFVHRAIFAWRKRKEIPMEYTLMNMVLACLRRVGIEPWDKIIIACDKGRSWRKEEDKQYKANRKEFREKFEDIDWREMFGRANTLLEKIDYGTNWQIVKLDQIEADDIMAVSSRYYKDNEVVLITYDKDMEQLIAYDNVKIFSPLSKRYKIVKNPYEVLAGKIAQEKSDNLINPILNKEDYERRRKIVSLLELPDFVENTVKTKLDSLEDKTGDIEYIPFERIRTQINGLYNDRSKVVTYEKCLKYKKTKKRKYNNRKKRTKKS